MWGDKGAWGWSPHWPEQKAAIHVAARAVTARDTVGAGDAFIGAAVAHFASIGQKGPFDTDVVR
jgi:sugar/nucleoside kinase (ribokinase family)